MSAVQKVKQVISPELKAFEGIFKDSLKSRVALLDKITHYIVKRKGKQMRPMFVFLCAKMMGEVNDSTYRAASLMELLHTATLVHDDVVDDAMERRGFFSINALWKNKIAVLVGDYLLSRSLILSVENDEFDHLRVVAKAVKDMSEGELLQMEKARGLNFSEDVYLDIIRQKTASLIASCCKAGAISVGASKYQAETFERFGELLGMAFQIKDDLFDYGSSSGIGKPTGIDIKERKLTLPIIHAYSKSTVKEKKKLKSLINKNGKKRNNVNEIVEFVIQKGGLEYADRKMRSYTESAISLLNQFPNTEAKEAMLELVDYTINRKK